MLLKSTDINYKEWDAFVLDQGGTIFSTSSYLEACAENWMVYWDKKRTFGIALPYTVKAGVKTLYPPFFSRYQEIVGDCSEVKEVINEIKDTFKRSLLSLRYHSELAGGEEYVYQEIDFEKRNISTNAKRQLKKFEQTGLPILDTIDYQALNSLITDELAKKLSVFSGAKHHIFNALIDRLKAESYLKSLVVKNQDELVGGIFYMEFGNRIIYLKGACKEDIKQKGGMYVLLNTLISIAESKNKIFDFGGSRVEGVREFNKKLGGVDVNYLALHWDNSPIWFKLAQRIKLWIKK